MIKQLSRLFLISLLILPEFQVQAQDVSVDTTWLGRGNREVHPSLASYYEIVKTNENDSIVDTVKRFSAKTGAIVYEFIAIKLDGGYVTPNGLCIKYYENGQISEQFHSTKGSWNGPYVSYYKNGQPLSKGVYDSEKGAQRRSGHWKFWHENGQLQSEGAFYNNQCLGKHTFYYTNGKRRAEMNFSKSGLQGLAWYWDEHQKKHLVLPDDQLMWTMALSDEDKKTLTTASRHASQPYNQDFDLSVYTLQRLKNGKNVLRFEDHSIAMICTIQDEQLQGEFIRYFKNGKIWRRGTYKDNKLDGLWTYYNSSGGIDYEIAYKDGERHGISRKHSRGVIWSETNYDKGVKAGPYTAYRKKDTNVGEDLHYEVGTYCNGKECGTKQKYYADAVTLKPLNLLEERDIYPDSTLFETITYHANGRVKSIFSLDRNLLSSEQIEFWPDGQVKYHFAFENNSFNDTLKTFHSNGKLATEQLVDSAQVLIWSAKDSAGTYQVENGNGMMTTREPSRINVKHYRNGKYVLKEVFNEDSTLLSTTEYSGRFILNSGQQLVYYGGDFLGRDVQNGKQTYYNLDGSKGTVWIFKNGVQHGMMTSYYPSGQVKVQSEYKNGYRNGIDLSYYPNGQLMTQSTYEDGELHGETTYYAEDGTLQGKMIHFKGDELQHIKY